MNRKYIESFVEGNFDTLFEISVRDKERCFLQNGGISQNCSNAWKAWVGKFKAEMFSIPPRSPDSNPIEIEDNLIKKNFEEFVIRVKKTMLGLDIDVVNQTLPSFQKQLKEI